MYRFQDSAHDFDRLPCMELYASKLKWNLEKLTLK